MRWIVAVLAMVLAVAGISMAQPAAFEVWVGNEALDELYVLDGRTYRILATIQVDDDGKPDTSRPHWIAFSRDGRYAYVTNVRAAANTRNLLVIDAAARKIVAALPAGPAAHAVTASPDGRRVWVANNGVDEISEVLVDGGSFRPGRRIASGGGAPHCVAFSRDGRTALIRHRGRVVAGQRAPGSFTLLEVESGRILKNLETGLEGCAVELAQDGRRFFGTVGFHATNGGENNQLMVLDTAGSVLHRAVLPLNDPQPLVQSQDGTALWIIGRGDDKVAVLDARTYRIITTYPTPEKAQRLEFSPDGRLVFFSVRGAPGGGKTPGIAIMNAATGRLLGLIPLDGDIRAIAVRALE